MLLGAISQEYDTIVEFTAFEDFVSYEKNGKNKIERVENHKIKVAIEVDMVCGFVDTAATEVYTVPVRSYTRGELFEVQVAKKYLNESDCVLVIDDFLAHGQALKGLMEIVRQSGANLAGCGIVIEKGFQDGGKLLREQGVNLQSLAIVDSIEDGKVTFREE